MFPYSTAALSDSYFYPDDDEEGEEGEEGEEKMPSCGDYIMHFLTLPWKLIFALIPPTGNHVFSIIVIVFIIIVIHIIRIEKRLSITGSLHQLKSK